MRQRRRHLINVLVAAGLLLGWFQFLRPASLGGPASYLLVQGHSMDGTLTAGDLVVVTRQDDYRTGDLVVFEAPVPGARGEAYVVHRIIAVDADGGMQTKGDNNPYADAWTITRDDVVGLERVRIPRFAVVHHLFLRLFNPVVIGALVGLFAFLLIGTGDDDDHDPDPGTDNDPGTTHGTDHRTDAGGDRRPERAPAGAARTAPRRAVRPAVAVVIALCAVMGTADRATAAELVVSSSAVTVRTFVCSAPTSCSPI